jgi:hypothetical protein
MIDIWVPNKEIKEVDCPYCKKPRGYWPTKNTRNGRLFGATGALFSVGTGSDFTTSTSPAGSCCCSSSGSGSSSSSSSGSSGFPPGCCTGLLACCFMVTFTSISPCIAVNECQACSTFGGANNAFQTLSVSTPGAPNISISCIPNAGGGPATNLFNAQTNLYTDGACMTPSFQVNNYNGFFVAASLSPGSITVVLSCSGGGGGTAGSFFDSGAASNSLLCTTGVQVLNNTLTCGPKCDGFNSDPQHLGNGGTCAISLLPPGSC